MPVYDYEEEERREAANRYGETLEREFTTDDLRSERDMRGLTIVMDTTDMERNEVAAALVRVAAVIVGDDRSLEPSLDKEMLDDEGRKIGTVRTYRRSGKEPF